MYSKVRWAQQELGATYTCGVILSWLLVSVRTYSSLEPQWLVSEWLLRRSGVACSIHEFGIFGHVLSLGTDFGSGDVHNIRGLGSAREVGVEPACNRKQPHKHSHQVPVATAGLAVSRGHMSAGWIPTETRFGSFGCRRKQCACACSYPWHATKRTQRFHITKSCYASEWGRVFVLLWRC